MAQNPRWNPLPFGTWVEFHDGKKIRHGRVRGHVLPGMPRPLREDSEYYPGGYIVSGHVITPGYGHLLRPLRRTAK